MAKRRNPFVEDFIPQSKVHVGLKQFNNNNNDDRLKKVYEKTLDLLFKGSKKILAQDPFNDVTNISTKKDNMKQLFIGKNGSLQHTGSGNMVMVPSSMKAEQCTCGGVVESPCAYCDQVLCGSCLHGCTRCEKPYCSHCVLVGVVIPSGRLPSSRNRPFGSRSRTAGTLTLVKCRRTRRVKKKTRSDGLEVCVSCYS